MTFLIGSKSRTPPIRENVQIIDNRADVANTSGVSLITVAGIDHLVVDGNESPARGTVLKLRDSSNVIVTSNSFPGASALLASTGSSAIVQNKNSV
jgi:hypothetical protein